MFEFGHEEFLDSLPFQNRDGKKLRVGFVTNDTGRDRKGLHLLERLASNPMIRLSAVFTPEHGFGSDAPDGEPVEGSVHPRHKIPIFSLYGKTKVPQPEQLALCDLLVYDIQDVGVRFYTYISTLRNVIEASSQADLPIHVLDRPDILGGIEVEGPMLTPGFESFVGHLPVPLRYGLTPGELATWWNSGLRKPARLKVWKCRDYRRKAAFEDLCVPWTKPSPSMLSTSTARFYPGTCLFEGTNISEGRGTEAPFQILGAPWTDPSTWLKALAPILPSQVVASEVDFSPTFSKFSGQICRGIRLDTNLKLLGKSVSLGIRVLAALMKSHPGKVEFPGRPGLPAPFFDHLVGNSWVREGLEKGSPVEEIETRMNAEAAVFLRDRKAYLIYPD